MSAKISFPREAVRQFAIVKQGLHEPPQNKDTADLLNMIHQIGILQLDSISVVARSHYLVMLSRMGLYDRQKLDSLLNDGLLFEQWAHVANILPMRDYAHFKPVIDNRRITKMAHYIKQRLGDNGQEILDHVLNEIRENGAMSSKEFKSDRKHEGGWWNWKPAKVALETLFDTGHLMVSYRQHFHRYYDLAENVLAGKTFEPKTLADYDRWSIAEGLRPQGVATADHIADYYRQPKKVAYTELEALLRAGQILEVEVEGWAKTAYIHHDDLPQLETIANQKNVCQRTTFLTPFDNLIWYRDRVEDTWDFYYRVEMYTPQAKRQYGYYVMPILHKDDLVGRIDPKIDRKSKTFLLQALHLEPETELTDELVQGLVECIQEFMTFHNCSDFLLQSCADEDLKRAIIENMPSS